MGKQLAEWRAERKQRRVDEYLEEAKVWRYMTGRTGQRSPEHIPVSRVRLLPTQAIQDERCKDRRNGFLLTVSLRVIPAIDQLHIPRMA
jgi:hypothetical protein